jgi:hypothetical protein
MTAFLETLNKAASECNMGLEQYMLANVTMPSKSDGECILARVNTSNAPHKGKVLLCSGDVNPNIYLIEKQLSGEWGFCMI